MKTNPKHLLVIRLSAMGDVAMTVPVLQAFLNQHPKVKVTVLTRAFFAPFFEHLPSVTVVTPDLKERHKGAIGLYRLYQELRPLQFDAVADLHNVLRSKILRKYFALGGIPAVKLDKGRSEKKELVKADPNKTLKNLKSMHERYADVFRSLGFTLDLSQTYSVPKLAIPQLKFTINSDKPIIGIAPFAAYESKSLPVPVLKRLLHVLNANVAGTIVLFGGGTEEKIILDGIAKGFDNVHSAVGIMTFKEELALISNLSLMLAMDSGNGHLAAMYGVPVITIWGLTHPCLGFAPFRQEEELQFTPNLDEYPLIPTSVYGKDYPANYLNCFNSISLNSIVQKVSELTAKQA